MSFFDKLTALIPFGKKEEALEYFFALNISSGKLTCALWVIEGNKLKIRGLSSETYSALDELTPVADKLLDTVLGIREIDVQKILFGVPNSWLIEDNLKEENLRVLKNLVKELELSPMAYVETSRALIHFLEQIDGVPPTAVLVGFEQKHLTVTVVRAGKLDGVKVVSRGESSASDIEKALLTFIAVETLPSKMLIYGSEAKVIKDQLLSYPWMSKLSFLHLPKIEILPDDIEIKSVCLAGASEIREGIIFAQDQLSQTVPITIITDNQTEKTTDFKEKDNGFIVGDIESTGRISEQKNYGPLIEKEEINPPAVEDVQRELPAPRQFQPIPFSFWKKSTNLSILLGIIGVLLIILVSYLFLPKAEVKIFVEPKILEKDAQLTADPNQKQVLEDAKIIPGQIIETEVSGTAKEGASGKKEVGDPAKGTVVIYNKTSESKSISKGITLSSPNGLKFTLDISVNIASQSANESGITYGKANATVTASSVGADGNLPSGSELTVSSLSSSQVSAKAEGNFSGGTSKQVTVVSSDDQQRLLAKLSSDLKQQAQQKLQEQFKNKKILTEALSENIIKKAFSKKINDQASDFSLNLTVHYKGTAFDDADLKRIVSKLITTQVPEGFQLDLSDTETQADVSKVEKDGRLIFLSRFKAKLLPKIDIEKIKNQIRGKNVGEAVNIIKGMDNVLGSEIKTSPALPSALQRVPILLQNIKIEVGLK